MTATGILHGALHLAQSVDGLPFDVRGAHGHVAGGVIQVQLEAVGAGVFEQLRVGDPAARRDAVERGDHRNADRALDPAQMLEVLVGPE